MIWQADGEKSTCGMRSDPSVGGVGRAGVRAAGSRGTPINGMAHFSMTLARVVYCRVVCFIAPALEDVASSRLSPQELGRRRGDEFERPPPSVIKAWSTRFGGPGRNAWILRLASRVGK